MAAGRPRKMGVRQRQNLPSREYRVLLRALIPSSPAASKVMRGNKAGRTLPEVRVRSLLHRMGLRFRINRWIEVEGNRTRPDLVFPKKRVVVYIDGCFWHGCLEHGSTPESNRSYWSVKLHDNVTRDRRVTAALLNAGWQVLRFWEHETPQDIAARIKQMLQSPGSS